MSPGIDMLYHYGPLNRIRNSEGVNAIETNVTHENFDYNRFRRHTLSILERIQRIAATEAKVGGEETGENNQKTVGESDSEKTVDISGLSELLEVLPNEQRSKVHMVRRSTLEAVEDDEEEDEDDLRKVGFKKEYGSQQNRSGENSEWVNENYELPTSEELFSDLGIWW